MVSVVVLHPGEMGAAVGHALVDAGVEVGWLPPGRSAATAVRARAAGLTERDELAGCDVVVSVCPPAHALDVARSVEGFRGLYVDANAISPARAVEVERTVTGFGASYVDGSIIGPPPQRTGSTRLYLCGPRAADIAAVFGGARIAARVLDDGPFAASALKMTYAAWTKISAALLLAARETAADLGVEESLVDEWALSQPELAQRYRSAQGSAAANGWRWAEEMRQIAATFDMAGQPGGFGSAAAEVFAQFPRPRRD